MARNSKNSKSSSRGSRSAAAPVAEPVLEEVDTGGAGIEEGIVFTTFALLAGAVFMIYSLLGERFPVEM